MTTLRLDAYGDPLPPFALARLGTVRWRHRGLSVDDLAFSRDGGTVYAAGGGLTAFDVATGKVRWSDPDPGASYVDLVPHPVGDRLLAVGLRGAVTLRDAGTGAPQWSHPQPSTSLNAVAVSHDSRATLVGGFGPYGALLDADGSTRAALPIDRGTYLNSASFAPDDATVVTTDCDGGVTLWSVAEGRPVRTFGKASLQPNVAAFTPDGRRLVVAACDGSVHVFDVATGETIVKWKAHRASASSAVVTPDGLRAVTVGEDQTLSLWRLTDGERLATRAAFRCSAALALAPDGGSVALAEGPRVVLVDLATFEERFPTAEHSTPIQLSGVAVDGDTVVSVASQREARWWSLAGGRALATLPLDAYVTALRPLPEADRYALMQPGPDGTPVLDVAGRALSTRPETFADTHQKWWGRAASASLHRAALTLTNARGVSHMVKAIAYALAFTPDDRFAVFFERSAVTVWDLERHAVAATAKVRQAVGLAVSPGGDEVAVCSAAAVHRFGLPDGVERAVWKAPPGVRLQDATYAPDGARVAVTTSGEVRLIDCATNAEVARLEGHAAPMTGACFDRDGGRLVTASWDTTALVWSVTEAIAGHAAAPRGKPRATRR